MRSAKYELNPIKRCGRGALNVLPLHYNFCFELQAKMCFLGVSEPLVTLGHKGIDLLSSWWISQEDPVTLHCRTNQCKSALREADIVWTLHDFFSWSGIGFEIFASFTTLRTVKWSYFWIIGRVMPKSRRAKNSWAPSAGLSETNEDISTQRKFTKFAHGNTSVRIRFNEVNVHVCARFKGYFGNASTQFYRVSFSDTTVPLCW